MIDEIHSNFHSSVALIVKKKRKKKRDLETNFNSEEDVLRWVHSKVERGKTFNICVSRDNMLTRGLKLWQHQKTGGPVNELKITFIGEAGIDTGALRKEFLSGK